MKALQHEVWSLIFLVFVVHLVNAEEQGNQVQQGIEKDLCPTPQVDFRWKRMLHWGTCEGKGEEKTFCKRHKGKKTSQGEDSQGGDLGTP